MLMTELSRLYGLIKLPSGHALGCLAFRHAAVLLLGL